MFSFHVVSKGKMVCMHVTKLNDLISLICQDMASKTLKRRTSQSVCGHCRSHTDKTYAVLKATSEGHVGSLLQALDAGGDVNCGKVGYIRFLDEMFGR